MKKMVLLLAMLVVPASPAAAREPLQLAPLKPWNLHYGEGSCQLLRTFGDPAKPTTLVLERLSPTASMSLMVFGGGLRSKPGDWPATAAFLPFADHRFTSAQVAETVDNKLPALVWTTVDLLPGWQTERERRSPPEDKPRDLAREAAAKALEESSAAQVSGIEIREAGGRRVVLATGSLKKANQMMRDCAREQLVSWGVDPDLEDRIVRPARSERSLADYIDSSDYPKGAILRGEQSIIQARLLIGADGAVTHCTSLTNFTAPEFPELVCRNLRRARFRPAELADGTKVPTYVTARVVFQLP